MVEVQIKPISITRFNALGGYARHPGTLLMLNELEYFEADGGDVIGIATQDIEDQDFGGIVMARDRKRCFRGVHVTDFFATPEMAQEALFAGMRKAAQGLAEDHYQGDEEGQPVDFFTHLHDEQRLHPSFVQLTTSEGYSPARGIIEPMMRWYEDADGNFIEQFQTTGFDQRIWELYLYAMLIEAGYILSREHNVPDFCSAGLFGELHIEAVTVGPTMKNGQIIPPPPMDTLEAKDRFLKEYMPIKFGSALFSKLKKKYWENSHVRGKPFVLAIADFSSPMSMIHSQSALERYLWGHEYPVAHDSEGKLIISPVRIETHQWGDKPPITSGFFQLPGSEHVSAVLSTNAGTIAKFNRLGILGKFGSKQVLGIREGRMVDHNPNATLPKIFRVIVNAAGYEETWIEGLNVYHNPNAAIPMAMEMLPGAAHHFFEKSGHVRSFTPEFHPMSSVTQHFAPVDVEEVLAEIGDKTHMVWTLKPGEPLPDAKDDPA
ncbi:hypothetical protein HFO41_31805 [Rhizobium leguminosarum]|uniref:hypothetical protein n=1 Tax=Rhizobium leguminosarum TaxID=384 RepID=UPI001C92618B|nr:hypothetical protein [Rhizobium leguminosarum]MBY3178716.1 hypothetical protein [Rhizobium leguminosarum]MBY5565418.1 hypothetical protein [Rhizobium leguminosarum]MBY5622150.1 hypothetical protein [Rhizobium leguminosarum]MBY5693365.1 hypothetical protein [Rhizobium leguminosarum]